jgi:sulfonate transport system substrate-binding protein
MKTAGKAIFCVFFAAGVFAATLSACHSPKEKIRIGLSREPLSGLAFIALSKGFFAREGLEVSVRGYSSGKLAMAGMFRGEVSLATVSGVASVLGIFQRDDTRILAAIGSSDNEVKIVARKDKGILRPEDLRGKRIATQEASAVHFFLSLFLGKHGLSERDVVLSFMAPPHLVDAFAIKDIDAFSMREPYISRAKKVMGENTVIFQEPGLYLKTFVVLGLEGFLRSHPLAVSAFLRGLLRAERFAREHPAEAAKIIAEGIGSDVSEMTSLLKDARLTVSLDESLLFLLEDEARWAVAEGLTDKIQQIPDFYKALYPDALESVRPQAVTVSRR